MFTVNSNKYSQDGSEIMVGRMLTHIVENVEIGNPLLIEFGGSTGPENSNFFRFMEMGLDALFIERDASLFAKLQRHCLEFPNLHALNASVGYREEDNLQQIMKQFPLHYPLAVSIDIDGDDALVFRHMGIQPELVIVEYNPTMPFDRHFLNPIGSNFGNSALTLCLEAESLGYFLAGMTSLNLVFLKSQYRAAFPEIQLSEHAEKLNLPRLALGYDGTLLSLGSPSQSEIINLGWDGLVVYQFLPRKLRKYSAGLSRRKLAFFVRYAITRPDLWRTLLSIARARWKRSLRKP